jgi:hypothetical protein
VSPCSPICDCHSAYMPLLSLWGETLNLHGLYPRKIANLSETDERALGPNRRDGCYTYRFPTFKTQKKTLPRLVIPGTVESRGRLGRAIAIFDSDCPGHCYSVLNNNGLLRAGEYHATGASLQGAGDYDSGFAADIAASCFYDNHCAVI